MANPPTSSGSSSSSRTSSSGGGGEHGGGSGVGVSISGEGVEVSNNGVGVSVGEHSVGASREFDLWPPEGAPPMVPPIPTGIPGLFITVNPAVKAQVSGSLNFEHATELTVSGRVSGSLMVGLEGGAPPAASIYLRGGPVLTGTLSITADRQGIKAASGRIDLDMNARIGVQVANTFDYGVDLGSARMFSFVGISYDRGRPASTRFQYGTFQLGAPLRSALEWVRSTVDRVVSLGSSAVSAVGGAMRNGASAVGRGLSAAYEWASSW